MMQLLAYVFFVELIIICNQHNFLNVKALIGHNISDAVEGDFPAVVCIAKIISGEFIPDYAVRCGGTLITQHHVLTAEHCLEMVQVSLYQVIVGSINLLYGLRRTPLWWMSHDQWAIAMDVEIEFNRNDIGILKLIPIENFHCNPSALYIGYNFQLTGLIVDIVGWGSTSSGECPMILQAARVTVLSNEQCESTVYNLDPRNDVFIHDRYICTIIEPYVLVGNGDSGGPVLFNNLLLGVTTGTAPDLNGYFHGGKVNCHTGVEFYRTFINDSLYM